MKPGDRLVCVFVESLPTGTQFKDWPLHVTIVPWFRLDLGSEQVSTGLRASYVGSKPFEIVVQAEAQLGYKGRKTVNLVAAPELMKLEGQTRRWLHAHKAWVVDEADKTRRGFRPHATHLKTGKLQEGYRFECDELSVVEQKGGYKEVTAVVGLGYETKA